MMYVTPKEAGMSHKLTGDQRREFMRKLAEIGQQVRQGEYPYDPHCALEALQDVVEGKFSYYDGGDVREYVLEYGPNVIKRLVDEGGPWSYRDSNISDHNYPISDGSIVKVRFKLISGDEFKLKRADGRVYRSEVEVDFARRGLRLPNAAEALLPSAKDRQLGRVGSPMVAFIGGSRDAFLVCGSKHERHLDQSIGCDRWPQFYVFLAILK